MLFFRSVINQKNGNFLFGIGLFIKLLFYLDDILKLSRNGMMIDTSGSFFVRSEDSVIRFSETVFQNY
jgi:hypothetical protein